STQNGRHFGKGDRGDLALAGQHRPARPGRPVPRMVLRRGRAVALRDGGDLHRAARGLSQMHTGEREGQPARAGPAPHDGPTPAAEDLRAVSRRELADVAPGRERPTPADPTRAPPGPRPARSAADPLCRRLRGPGPFAPATRTGRPAPATG